ncbi:hypothetical protein KAR91_60415 [Candidatus Pacearchaeota archaeon]|nr:hypothetical protein [Candidatus Pacearchaeota archaeon]
MRMWIDRTQTPSVLFLVPENDHERISFEKIADLDEPLAAVRKHGLDFLEAHLEIRKENS